MWITATNMKKVRAQQKYIYFGKKHIQVDLPTTD